MSNSQRIADILNRRGKDGCDLVGGADEDALQLLLITYMDTEGHGPHSPQLEEDYAEGFSGHFSENCSNSNEPCEPSDDFELFDPADDFYDPFDEESESPIPSSSQSSSVSSVVSQSGSSASQCDSSASQPSSVSALSSSSHSGSSSASSRHRTPQENLDKFWASNGCGCKLNKGQPCYTRFSREHYADVIDQCCTLTHAELDLVILGQIMAHLCNDDDVGPKSKHQHVTRQRSRLSFYHHGVHICKVTFLILHGIGKDRFQALKAHYMATGLTLRTHGNYKRLPPNTLSYRDVENVKKYLHSYAESHAMLLPGRVPGYKRDDLQLLPSSTTKKFVWSQYKVACEQAGIRAAAYNTFCTLWRTLVPQVTVMKPMTDLCWVCQQNSTALMRAANTPEQDKSEIVRCAEAHLKIATEAREYLKQQVKESKTTIKEHFTDQGLAVPAVGACEPPKSHPITVHFSFDMAQQVHYPHDPQQPGPVYFLTPRKCGIFGVCCEAISRQVNYLIDEGMNIGKGGNCIISLLHHFLSHHNMGELNLCVHADNCSGQNKNRYMMQYLAWRVESGLNDHIEISFLIVGHTKFSPDWCFGLVKQAFRRTKIGCLDDIARVVNSSAEVNHAQLVGSEDGTVYVPQYDWAKFFAPIFKRDAFKGIKSLHHLVFEKGAHGKAMIREHAGSEVRSIDILSKQFRSWSPSPDELPPVIPPPGLSAERRTYLFDKIREFCPDSCKDIVCPNPNPPPSSLSSFVFASPMSSSSLSSSPLSDVSPSLSRTPSPKRSCITRHNS